MQNLIIILDKCKSSIHYTTSIIGIGCSEITALQKCNEKSEKGYYCYHDISCNSRCIMLYNKLHLGEKINGIPFTVSLSKHPSEFLYGTNVAGVDINLERKSTHVHWTYFFPMIVYVMLSWISFAIPNQIVSTTTFFQNRISKL